MRILDRYLIKQFLLVLLFSLLAFWVISLVVDVIEHLDTFIDRQATLSLIIQYYIYFTPYILILTLPVAMLLSTLFSLGLLAKNNEITAMKSTGISLYRIFLPLFILSFLISLVSLVVAETVVPYTNFKQRETRYAKIEKKSPEINVQRYNVFVQGEDNRIFYMRLYDRKQKIGTDVLVQRFEDNHLKEQIQAQRMVWEDNGWQFENGRFRVFADSAAGTDKEEYEKFDRLFRLDLKMKPEILAKIPKKPEQMSYSELSQYVEVKERSGQDTAKEKTELNLKIAFPFINLIILLFGAPLAANPRRSGLAIGFALSLFTAFVFYILIRFGQSLGYNHTLPPALAAWLANILFIILGIVLLIKARK